MTLNKKSVFYHPDIIFSTPRPAKYQIPDFASVASVLGYNFIDGFEISYLGDEIPDGVEIFFERKLILLGWENYYDLYADGPFGNAWSYVKGEYIIVFIHTIIHKTKIKHENPWVGPIRHKLTVFVNDSMLFNL